jgi:hypothetical protein
VSIDWFRDLIISILGLVATGVLILVAVLLFLLYRRTRAILDSAKGIMRTAQDISSYAAGGVAKPLVQVAAIIQGISRGIEAISKLRQKKKGDRDE